MGEFITAKVFTVALGSIENLPIVNFAYVYDAENDERIILEEEN